MSSKTLKIFTAFSLTMLLLALLFGSIASFAFLYPECWNRWLPFQQLRPMHVSAALFWIISGAAVCVLFFSRQVFGVHRQGLFEKIFIHLWMATVACIFGAYALGLFGGREYWEFPPILGIPLLAAWLCLMLSYFRSRKRSSKGALLYVWMWTTGIVFFLLTFLEQNLYHIPWFRSSFLKEVTVQWKSNGAMVGAWNQMIYGSALYLMTRLSGREEMARSNKAFFFYFLGLGNLMFNWGHHLYNVPTASWIRHVSYAVSMTEWILFISILRDFRSKLSDQRTYSRQLGYRFLAASEYWVVLNLLLALLMSIPAVNRYTHGTHVTVAHAMGATIGINTMILLGCIGSVLDLESLPARRRRHLQTGFVLANISLFVFWVALIAAGMVKGYRDTVLNIDRFQEMMRPVYTLLHLFAFAGIALLAGLGLVLRQYFAALSRTRILSIPVETPAANERISPNTLAKHPNNVLESM